MVLPLSSINTGGSAKILALANPPLMAGRLSDLGFEPEEDGSVLLQRTLSADGRSVCRIGGRPARLTVDASQNLIIRDGCPDGRAVLTF